ncbi:VOC family protein [Rhodococcus sp. (in: high G+C Gram-positive bacteria)]|uniref:VOC family protein n=1 Tax=Rhodococcus sp. TaxID=1831 RepID=UPI003B8A8215
MAIARMGSITLDCADPPALAAFWRGLLGGEITRTGERYVSVRFPGGLLTAMCVPGYRPPTWPRGELPKQIHLDVVVDDLDAAVIESVKLGARLAPEQYAPTVSRVLLDPAGHPFCVCLPVGPLSD